MTPSAEQLFDRANELWFHEGFTSKAIESYAAALGESGGDPVVAFQLAVALLALGRNQEARQNLAIAEQQRDRLGSNGRAALETLARRCSDADDTPPGEAGAEIGLDIEHLIAQPPSDLDWHDVALSAEERGLHGVALRAYQLYSRDFADPELLRDEEAVRLSVEKQLRLLKTMRKELRG